MSRTRCPKCKNAILQKSDKGEQLRIKGKLFFVQDRSFSHCFWCNELIEVPLKLNKAESFVIREPYPTKG